MKGGIAELLNFKQKRKNMDEFIKVPVSEKLAYCFGDPALTLMYTMTSTLLIYFYTNVVGISAGAVGMIMLAFPMSQWGRSLIARIPSMARHASGFCVWQYHMPLQRCYCLPCRMSAISARSFMPLSPIT